MDIFSHDARQRYDLTLLKQNNKEIWIGIKPKSTVERANWIEAKVILDATNHLPLAVQLVDATGTRTIVHTFQKLKINPTDTPPSLGLDPFDLPRGFDPVTAKSAEEPDAAQEADSTLHVRFAVLATVLMWQMRQMR